MASGSSFWGNLADAFVPGDAYGPNGWDRRALTSGLLQMGGNMIAPGMGTLGGMAFRGFNGGGLAGLFGGTNPAINQMANPPGNGYDLKPWGGLGLPGMGQNPFAVNYQPPASRGLSGGSGARGAFTFGGYASPAHRAASIDATQQGIREAGNVQGGQRQTGADWRGNTYER